MRAVSIETDTRPVREVVTGEGGMERGRGPKRTGRIAVTLTGDTSKAAKQMSDFAKAMAGVTLAAGLDRRQFKQLQAQVSAFHARPPVGRAFTLARWKLAALDHQIQVAVIAYGEAIIRSIGWVERQIGKFARWLKGEA